MSLDAIKSIASAEEQAQQDIAAAKREAEKSVAAAREAGDAVIAKAKDRADGEISALMKATERKAAENAAELMENTANKCAAITARAENRMDEAASLIVRRVIKG